jgi:hypothetical protein
VRSVRLLDRLANPRAFQYWITMAVTPKVKCNPVQADRATKRENHNNAADAVNHVIRQCRTSNHRDRVISVVKLRLPND